MDDRTLRCVLAVADAGSLRGAARALNVAPSMIQRTIAGAEKTLGGLLFERGAAGARVTDLGRAVVRHAQERRDLEATFADEIARIRTVEIGEVSIAVGLGYLDDIGEQVLAPFQRAHPDVVLRVLTGGTDSMVEALASDAADLAIALHPSPHPEIEVVRSGPQPLGLACSVDHPIAQTHPRDATLAPAELAQQRFAVMLTGFGLRALHDEFARVHGVEARIVVETDSQAVLTGAVARGQAVSLLPPVFLTPAPSGSDVVLFDVDDAHLRSVSEALMVRRHRRLPHAARALLEACTAWMDNPTARA